MAHSQPAGSQCETLHHLVDHLAHLLPAQGPIGVFIHHNTLHAFQHLPFEQAVTEAARTYGTEPFLTEEHYREHLRTGRILPEDIAFVLNQEPDAPILPRRLSRRQLRQAMLSPGLRRIEPASLVWELSEGGLLDHFRRDLPSATLAHLQSSGVQGSGQRAQSPAALERGAVRWLYQVCQQRTEGILPANAAPSDRLRDTLLARHGVDLDEVIHPLLIRLCGAYLDQGMAYWPMPHREHGFLPAVIALLSQPGALYPEHLERLGEELRAHAGQDAFTVILALLHRWRIPAAVWERTLRAELLALPGWAGLMRRLEEEPQLHPHEHLPCKLADFLAVRLILTAVAAAAIERLPQTLSSPAAQASQAAAALLFDVAQLTGLAATGLSTLPADSFDRLWAEIASFDDWERRRVWHLAYERRHELQVLPALAWHWQHYPPQARAARPSAQVFFCIDEREESIRRHLEEADPTIETWSAAGFFGVAVDYTGIDDAHGASYCPVVVKPQHAVHERPVGQDRVLYERRQARRRVWARLMRTSFLSSRTLVRGWVSTAGLGLMSLFPLAGRVLAPHAYSRLVARLNDSFFPEPRTELTLERQDSTGHQAIEGLLLGFSVAEKADRVAGVLGSAGLTRGFARLVTLLGHGSTSLNNPHESAHDCGACGGRRGGPNARLFAAMANHPGVRAALAERGFEIPADTWFVGGYHDTCNDDVILFDLAEVPASHHDDLDRLRATLDRARAGNALERSRRFFAASPGLSPGQALHHVQERAEHLAEPRPEYGHATNAVCIVGRRASTRGLFLDRRAFLVSYDPGQDPQNQALARLLGAVVPVCAGINLEYYFSSVDNEGYGCGTKLPHNVTGLVGIMNGHASDLRTGLPWQMVEVHEPVRILFVIETTPERLMPVIDANPQVAEFVHHRWVRVAVQDPDTGQIQILRDGRFEPVSPAAQVPVANSSVEWFRGQRDYLPAALIAARTAGEPLAVH